MSLTKKNFNFDFLLANEMTPFILLNKIEHLVLFQLLKHFFIFIFFDFLKISYDNIVRGWYKIRLYGYLSTE